MEHTENMAAVNLVYYRLWTIIFHCYQLFDSHEMISYIYGVLIQKHSCGENYYLTFLLFTDNLFEHSFFMK